MLRDTFGRLEQLTRTSPIPGKIEAGMGVTVTAFGLFIGGAVIAGVTRDPSVANMIMAPIFEAPSAVLAAEGLLLTARGFRNWDAPLMPAPTAEPQPPTEY